MNVPKIPEGEGFVLKSYKVSNYLPSLRRAVLQEVNSRFGMLNFFPQIV